MITTDYNNEFFFWWVPPMQSWPAFDSWEMWYGYCVGCLLNISIFTIHFFGESND